jgi:hypothetical protein
MNAIDLCVVADVNSWLGNSDPTTDSALIQQLITAFSQDVITETGRGTDLYSQTAASERYNGNGSDRLMLRRYPIVSVASLTVNNQTVTQSPDGVQAGFVVDTAGNANSLVLIGGSSGFTGSYTQVGFGGGICRFAFGTQNIAVTYTAGYATVPYDLNQAAISIVGENYRRRKNIGQASQMQPNVGQTTFRSWRMTPQDMATVIHYKRTYLD